MSSSTLQKTFFSAPLRLPGWPSGKVSAWRGGGRAGGGGGGGLSRGGGDLDTVRGRDGEG